MDKKIKTYLGYILTIALVLVGLNEMFGGNPVIVSNYALLPILAVVTPIYYIFAMRKKN